MRFVKPYNDEKMLFDSVSKRYVLNKVIVEEEFGNPYQDDKVLERRIKKNSRVVYQYIYQHGNTANRPIVDKILNGTEEGRNILYEALMSQMESDLETGVNSLGDLPAINTKGQILDEETMASRILTQNTRNIIDNASGSIGINITCAVPYNALIVNFVMRQGK